MDENTIDDFLSSDSSQSSFYFCRKPYESIADAKSASSIEKRLDDFIPLVVDALNFKVPQARQALNLIIQEFNSHGIGLDPVLSYYHRENITAQKKGRASVIKELYDSYWKENLNPSVIRRRLWRAQGVFLNESLSHNVRGISDYWYGLRNEFYTATYHDDEGNEVDILQDGKQVWKPIHIPPEAGDFIDFGDVEHYEKKIKEWAENQNKKRPKKLKKPKIPIALKKVNGLKAALKRRDEAVKKLREVISNMSSP